MRNLRISALRKYRLPVFFMLMAMYAHSATFNISESISRLHRYRQTHSGQNRILNALPGISLFALQNGSLLGSLPVKGEEVHTTYRIVKTVPGKGIIPGYQSKTKKIILYHMTVEAFYNEEKIFFSSYSAFKPYDEPDESLNLLTFIVINTPPPKISVYFPLKKQCYSKLFSQSKEHIS